MGNHRWKGRLDLLNIFLIGLGSDVADAGNEDLRLQRFLGTVFSDKMKPEDKIGLLENEFGIPMEKELEEGLNDMCNLSQGIKEKAEARGEVRGEAKEPEELSILILGMGLREKISLSICRNR